MESKYIIKETWQFELLCIYIYLTYTYVNRMAETILVRFSAITFNNDQLESKLNWFRKKIFHLKIWKNIYICKSMHFKNKELFKWACIFSTLRYSKVCIFPDTLPRSRFYKQYRNHILLCNLFLLPQNLFLKNRKISFLF